MSKDFDGVCLNGAKRYDVTLIAGTARSGRLPPGCYIIVSSIASFVGVASVGDAATSITTTNGMPMAIGGREYVDIGIADPGYEIQAAAAGAGTLTVFGPV